MSTKKVVAIVLATNLILISLALGLLGSGRPVQAEPAAVSAVVGPFYVTYSGADLHAVTDAFAITREDGNWGVVRQSTIGVGTAGIHLPAGATITQLMNDSNNVDGPSDVRIRSCAIGGVGYGQCTELALARKNDSGRGQVTTNLSWATNPYTEALHLELFLNNNNSIFYYARIAYTLPAPTFLPLIQR